MKQKFQSYPTAVRVILTAVVVAVLSVVLTFWRHNGSTYLTGFWDNGSQTLVFGRMLQMQQNQSSPGGFMGVYTQDWSDEQNRYWYRDNTPVSPQEFHAYTHQTGLQGWAFGVLNKVLSVFEDHGEMRETMLYSINSMLFYAASLLVCLAVRRVWGPLSALAWLAAVVFAPWPQRGMKDLYWCLWTWLLPALAGLLLCAVTRQRGKTPWWCYGLVFCACMVRCMCGFEFISTFLILCEAPLVYCWANGEHRAWLRRMVITGFSAVGGVAAALGVWFVQGILYFGSAAGSWQNLTGAVTSRVSLTDGVVSDVSIAQVLARYFVEIDEPLLQFGSFVVTLKPLIAAVLLCFAVCAAVLFRYKKPLSVLAGPLLVWLLSLAAPVSWMVLSKAHAYVHTHLAPMLWHFALVPVSCALIVWLVKTAIAACRHP